MESAAGAFIQQRPSYLSVNGTRRTLCQVCKCVCSEATYTVKYSYPGVGEKGNIPPEVEKALQTNDIYSGADFMRGLGRSIG